MVGVIAHDRQRGITKAELDALASCYEAVRGAGTRHLALAGAYAGVVKIDALGTDQLGIEEGEQGWAVATGVLYGASSLLAADLRTVDGQFALVRYDACIGEVQVISDPFGMHLLYTAEHDGKTYFSTSALALARHLHAPVNPLAGSLLVCCGDHFGPLTYWQGIERVDPATLLAFTADGPRKTTYWRLEVDERIARLGFRQAADYAVEVASETFRRYLTGRPCVWTDLTGGFDSRLLAALLARVGAPFRANTVGLQHSPDVQLGRKVARAAGWDWSRFRVPEQWPEMIADWLPLAVAWADGSLPALDLAGVLWVHARQGASYHALYGGGGAEWFRGHSWQQEFFQAGRTTRVNYDNLITMRMMRTDALQVLSPCSVDAVQSYLRAYLEAQSLPYAHCLNTTQLDAISAYRSRSWHGTYASAAGAFLSVQLPLYSRPILSAGFSIDYRHRSQHRLMRAMIARINPRAAAVPTTAGGPAEPWRFTNCYRFVPYYTQQGQKAITKLSRKHWGKGLLAAKALEDPRLMAARRTVINRVPLSVDTMHSQSIFQKDALANLLQRSKARDFDQTDLMSRVITVELTLRAAEMHQDDVYGPSLQHRRA
jgi:hypothetical protein